MGYGLSMDKASIISNCHYHQQCGMCGLLFQDTVDSSGDFFHLIAVRKIGPFFNLSLHCSTAMPQLCSRSSPYLQMKEVSLSSPLCLQLMRDRLPQLAIATCGNSVPIFSLRKFQENVLRDKNIETLITCLPPLQKIVFRVVVC